MTTLLIDADILVYSCAFAAQKTLYFYKGVTFPCADDCKAWCSENQLDYATLRKSGEITTRVEVLPSKVAKTVYTSRLKQYIHRCGGSHVKFFLSGDGNFREQVAVTKPYKGNRTQPKPEHYLLMRDMVLGERDVTLTTGIEADDAIGIAMGQIPKAAVLSTDKDLTQIAGRHYNWDHNSRFSISKREALRAFHVQALCGDATDNIPGLPGVGRIKAAKMLEGCTSPKHEWDKVLEAYSEQGMDYLEEQATLVWILKQGGEVWSEQHYRENYLNGYDSN